MTNPSVIVSISITLGNSAMSDRDDVSTALDAVSARILGGENSGIVRDLNGNTVGSFAAVWPEVETLEPSDDLADYGDFDTVDGDDPS